MLVLLVACSPAAGWRSRPANTELRSSHYSDNSGLSVLTVAGAAEQPISAALTATLRGVADRVVVERTVVEVPPAIVANQATGHVDELSADIVTSASSVLTGGPGSEKWRFEAVPGLRWEGGVGSAPASVGGSLRISTEPDYDSVLGLVQGSVSLFEENTTLSTFAGYGQDEVSPAQAPPGQLGRYPATHWRVLGGASLSQLLSPRWLASLGASLTLQQGTLSNPYRRATVRTSLFPEALPESRTRATAFVASSLHLGWSAAAHARLGGYFDSWGVRSLIPQLALSKVWAERLLLELEYRHYRQSKAEFYQPAYDGLAPVLAGDMRLGRIVEHAGGLELEWQLAGRRGGFGSLRASGRLELTRLRYLQLPSEAILGKIFQLGLLASY